MSCLHWRRKFSTISSVILCCLPCLPWPPWAVLTDRIIPIHVAPHKVAKASTVVSLSQTFLLTNFANVNYPLPIWRFEDSWICPRWWRSLDFVVEASKPSMSTKERSERRTERWSELVDWTTFLCLSSLGLSEIWSELMLLHFFLQHWRRGRISWSVCIIEVFLHQERRVVYTTKTILLLKNI
jgi:hypothetical protein